MTTRRHMTEDEARRLLDSVFCDQESEGHVTNEEAIRYAAGRDIELRARVDSHLGECEDCRQFVNAFESAVDASDAPPAAVACQVTRGEMTRSRPQKRKNAQAPADYRNYNLFAWAQTRRYWEEKRKLASWVLKKYPPDEQTGIYLDAGSTPFAAWGVILERVAAGECLFPTIVTPNLMILFDWTRYMMRPEYSTVQLCAMGGGMEANHMTFLPSKEAVLKQAAETHFFQMFVGATGLQVDPKGGLRLGYHADFERETKEALFAAPCQHRIILLTAGKVGNAGAKTFNMLDGGPSPCTISIVSEHPRNPEHVKKLNDTIEALHSKRTLEALWRWRIRLEWWVVDTSRAEPCHTRYIPISMDEMENLRREIESIPGAPASSNCDFNEP